MREGGKRKKEKRSSQRERESKTRVADEGPEKKRLSERGKED